MPDQKNFPVINAQDTSAQVHKLVLNLKPKIQFTNLDPGPLTLFKIILVTCALSLVTMAAPSALAETIIPGGDITQNTTWDLAGSPYIVLGSITVKNGATLTIEPGVEVRAEVGAGVLITIGGIFTNGTLIADGTEQLPILFTSNTNNKQPGDWAGIALVQGTQDSTVLNYCTIEYAGSLGLNMTGSSAATVTNSIIRKSSGDGVEMTNSITFDGNTVTENNGKGIRISGGLPTIRNTTISNNGGIAVTAFSIKDVRNMSTGNVITGNGQDMIEWTDPATTNVNFSMTLHHQGVPYVASSTIKITNNSTLTIEPGVEIRFKPQLGLSLQAGDPPSQTGTIVAQGTDQQHILLTSNAAKRTPGDWTGIRFTQYTGASSFNYVDVEYGGDPGFDAWGSSNATIDHTNIRYSSGKGIVLTADSILRNSVIESNAAQGIYVPFGSPSILSNVVQNNTSTGLWIDVGATAPVMDGNQFLDNGARGANIYKMSQLGNTTANNIFVNVVNPVCDCIEFINTSDTILGTSMTLHPLGLPYVVDGNILVYNATAKSTLTMDAGVVAKFKPGQNLKLQIGGFASNEQGALVTNGTPDNPVLLTSNRAVPLPGDWQGIRTHAGNRATAPFINSMILEYGANPGIVISNTHLEIRDSFIQNNAGDGIRLSEFSSMNAKNTSFLQNGQKAINNMAAAGVSFAELNWWGSAQEPVNQISGDVRYEAWLEEPASQPFHWNSYKMTNQAFNQHGGLAKFRLTYPGEALWTFEILDANMMPVKTLNGQGFSPLLIDWEGDDQNNEPLPDGTYTYRVSAMDINTQQQASPAFGDIDLDGELPVAILTTPAYYEFIPGFTNFQILGSATDSDFQSYMLEYVDTTNEGNRTLITTSQTPVEEGLLANWNVGNITYPVNGTMRLTVNDNSNHSVVFDVNYRLFNLHSMALSEDFISPNNDTQKDTTTISAQSTFPADWLIEIKNAAQQVVRIFTQNNMSLLSFVWDGKDNDGILLPDGVYTYQITIIEPGSGVSVPTQPGVSPITIDTVPPDAAITEPLPEQEIWGLSHNIIGTASDLNNIENYTVSQAPADDPNNYTLLGSGNNNVENGLLAVWNGLDGLENGGYIVRLLVIDKADNESEVLVPVTLNNVDITNVSRSSEAIDHKRGETVQMNYHINHDADVTLKIYAEAGDQLVRTLVDNESRLAGDQVEVWDGTDDVGTLLPYEAYYFDIMANTAERGGDQFIDPMGPGPGTEPGEVINSHQNRTFDPFKNERLSLTYPTHAPGRQAIEIRPQQSGELVKLILGFEPLTTGVRIDQWNGRNEKGNIYSEPYHLYFDDTVAFREHTMILRSVLEPATNFLADPYGFIDTYGGITTFQYEITTEALVTVQVEDANGLFFRELVSNELQNTGTYFVDWDGLSDLGERPALGGLFTVRIMVQDPVSGAVKETVGNMTVFV